MTMAMTKGISLVIRQNRPEYFEIPAAIFFRMFFPAAQETNGRQYRPGGLVQEAQQLRVALLDGADRAARQEAITQVADGALDLALVLGPSDGAQEGLDVELGAQVQQLGMIAHGVALAL